MKGKQSLTGKQSTLFDIGLQKSFILREAASALKWPRVRKVSLIMTVLLANKKCQTFDLVKTVMHMGRYKHWLTGAILEKTDSKIISHGLRELN